SLGLTLYELLTLRPAFDESDRGQLLRKVMHEEPPPPRKLNPAVPRDLETIVLKAIARDPGHRYATAADLAADLRRFVEDRPIRALRVGTVERPWRWARRNPALAGMTAAVAVLLLALALGATAAAISLKHSADVAEQARKAEEDQRKLADIRGGE